MTDGPQSVSMTAAEKGQGGAGIGRLLYVTVLALQLRRNSCISASIATATAIATTAIASAVSTPPTAPTLSPTRTSATALAAVFT